jgi:hypothetical protein
MSCDAGTATTATTKLDPTMTVDGLYVALGQPGVGDAHTRARDHHDQQEPRFQSQVVQEHPGQTKPISGALKKL